MSKEKYSDYQKLTLRDIAELCVCSEPTAQKIKNEMKSDLGIKTKYIFYFQFKAYFCEFASK